MSPDPRDARHGPDVEPDPREDETLTGEPLDPSHTQASDVSRTPPMPVVPRFETDQVPVIQPAIVRTEPPRRGCLLPGLGVLVLATGLLVAGLLLPPFGLWDALMGRGAADAGDVRGQAFDLSADSPRAEADGLVIEADPSALAGAYRVYAVSLAPADYLAQTTPAEGWNCAPALPSNHALVSAVYSLAQAGTPPDRLTVQVAALDEASAGGLPPAALSLYAWNAAVGAWQYVPNQGPAGPGAQAATLEYLPRCVALFRTAPSARQVGVVVAVDQPFRAEIMAANVRAFPAGLRPTATGALQGMLAAGFEAGQGYEVLPLIQNFEDPTVIDVATVERILSQPGLRQEHARQVAAFALREDTGYSGVMIDYREAPPDLRAAYVAFLRELADLLHGGGRSLGVVLPPPALDPDTQSWDGGAYDWAAIGHAVDWVVLDLPPSPAVFLPGGMADRLLAWAVSQVSPSQLMLGLSARGVEEQAGGIAIPLEVGGQGDVVMAIAPGAAVEAGLDEATGAPYVRVQDAPGGPRTIWLVTAAALHARMERADPAGLAGVVVWDALAEDAPPGIGDALLAYQLGEPLAAPAGGTWRALAGATVLAEADARPGASFAFDVPADAEAVTLELRAGEDAALRVALVGAESGAAPAEQQPPPAEEPAATPPPLPLAPQEPVATEGAQEPAAPAEPVAGLEVPTVDPAALSAVDVPVAFEVGAFVGRLNAAAILTAGRVRFDWLAVEVDVPAGADPAAQQRTLDDARANGFKALFSLRGDAAALAADPAGYMNEFAAYAGRLAAMGAAGVEVWPEMNGPAQITPEAYVQLLGLTFNAVKTANPDTLVITGGVAPIAPGGQDTAFTWTTDTYIESLAAAGAGEAADCIGVHYTQGALPPDATGGDVRGSATFYFLPLLLDHVRAAFPEAPLCVTRLGYLSPEGWDAVPPGYEWAQDITAARQAEWLAAAVGTLAAGEDVWLALVWNLDAATFDESSASGGYALVRPGGACPACDALEPLLR